MIDWSDNPLPGHIVQLRLFPVRPFWHLGPGWAAVGGALAGGAISTTPSLWVSLLLVWLLADPILGTIWDVGVGGPMVSSRPGVWRRFLTAQLPERASVWLFLPYTLAGTQGGRLAIQLGRLRRWWDDKFWPQAGWEFVTLVVGIGVAVLVGALLGLPVLLLVLLSVLLSWQVAGLQEKQHASKPFPRTVKPVLRALAEFCIPWFMGVIVLGELTWPIGLLGFCFSIAYLGMIYPGSRFLLLGLSQFIVICLLTGLHLPLAAACVAILLLAQWGLRLWANYHPGAMGLYLKWMNPMVLGCLAVVVLAMVL